MNVTNTEDKRFEGLLTYEGFPVWGTGSGGVIVWGTHDRTEVEASFRSWVKSLGEGFRVVPADEPYDATHGEEYHAGVLDDRFHAYHGHERLLDMEDWPSEFVSDDPYPGSVPFVLLGFSW